MSALVLAGRPLPNAADNLRRYVGLPWSRGRPEVWAYHYYDQMPDLEPTEVLPVDVLAAAALHPRLTQRDLSWFVEHRDELSDFLAALPDADLAGVDAAVLDCLPTLADTGVELSLLTKVLHRKRPKLVPMLDRRLVDWYRLRLTVKGVAAWPELTRALAADLLSNEPALEDLRKVAPLSNLRIADITIWMESVK